MLECSWRNSNPVLQRQVLVAIIWQKMTDTGKC